jgi:hypothetical protein
MCTLNYLSVKEDKGESAGYVLSLGLFVITAGKLMTTLVPCLISGGKTAQWLDTCSAVRLEGWRYHSRAVRCETSPSLWLPQENRVGIRWGIKKNLSKKHLAEHCKYPTTGVLRVSHALGAYILEMFSLIGIPSGKKKIKVLPRKAENLLW